MDSNKLLTLMERAKELECVYAVDEVLQNRALTLPEMMIRLTAIIPTGFSYPNACRVRISLWSELYETPGFDGAEIIYTAPVLNRNERIGEISAGYRPELLEEACHLLQYEIKLMDTISQRISQLALGRQRELALLMGMLRQIDPDMIASIGEKMRIYLGQTVGREAEALFRMPVTSETALYGEINTPTEASPHINTEVLVSKIVEGAVFFLSQDTLLRLLGTWIHEQRVLAFVKIVDRKDARISDILDAIRKYTGAMLPELPGDPKQFSQTEKWLLSELTHRFLSDDEHLINLVLDDLSIPDFAPMIEHIIGSERSMGNVGGKGAGIFIASQILRHAAGEDPLLRDIRIPKTWYIATDQLIDFLHYNKLEELNSYKYNATVHLRMTYDRVAAKIKNAALPPQTVNMLRLVLEDMNDVPLIIRSSSLLEDKHSGSFSGKYKSLFVRNRGTRQERLDALVDAVLEVYASMYNPDSIQYSKERGLLNFSEQMGVLIQEVVGQKIGPYFMPVFAGVAFSKNLLRWSPRIKQEDGLVRLAMGLGTRAVDRVNNDYPIMFSPGSPKLHINQSPSDIRHYSPKHIDLIHLENGFTTVEAASFFRETGKVFPQLHRYVSVFENDFIAVKNAFTLNPDQDEMVITFHHALTASDFPEKIKRIMDVLSQKLGCPVDIEFAYDGEHLYLLQCRPQGTGRMHVPAPIPQNIARQDTLFTANRFISDGLLQNLAYVVYVDPDAYNALATREEMLAVGEAVGLLNDALPRKKFILMGPGRWGSRGDIKLGVRVTYSDISNTAALIEIAKERHAYVPELSFGTHFFQDLVESNIVYIPLYPGQKDVIFREGFFHSSANALEKILPGFAWLADTVKVIDIPASTGERTLSIHLNSDLNQAIAFFTKPQKEDKENAGPAREAERIAWQTWSPETEQENWQWRHYMAQQIAEAMDMDFFGVKGIYLFGSTGAGDTGIGSDIDLLIHVEDDRADKTAALQQWLDGWSRALARINFLQTGHDTDKLLDIHMITDKDIERGDSFAVKIHSATDPAKPLRLRE